MTLIEEGLCPHCSGSGEGQYEGCRCSSCKGKGYAAVEVEIYAPDEPLALKTSITVITPNTTKEQADAWAVELNKLYDTHYQGNDWTWYDANEIDHLVFMELAAVCRAYPTKDLVITDFLTPDWRDNV